MRRRPDSEGFAMLSALVVMAIAASLAMVVTGVAAGLFQVAAADAAAWRADALTSEGVAAAADAMRWSPAAVTGALGSLESDRQRRWSVSWEPAALVSGDPWSRELVQVAAASGAAARETAVTVDLQAAPWAAGVVCASDALVASQLRIEGSGLYTAGTLSGRENVVFTAAGPASAGPPPDFVHGDLWPQAGVHAGVSIFDRGVEVHEAGGSAAAEDSDAHAGPTLDGVPVGVPDAAFVAAAAARSVAPGEAFDGAHLDLSRLRLPPASAAEAAGGLCVVLDAATPVEITGDAPSDVRLLLVVAGDAVAGSPAGSTSLSGAVVVTGRLTVRGALSVDGCLCAGRLEVFAPTAVRVEDLWRRHLLSGACDPRVVEIGVGQAG